MNVTISKATVLDNTRIVRLLLDWLDEAVIKGFPGLCGYTGLWIADLLSRHVVFIATQGDKLLGGIGLKLGFMPWNNEIPVLFNEFLMTDKKSRELGVADKLIKAAKDFSEQSKTLLMMGHFSGTDPELKDRYLRMRGFSYAGANFIYKGE